MATVEDIIKIGFNNHQEGNLEYAESAYLEALALDCENAEICNLMGVLKLQQNDADSAIDWVEKAVNRKPCEYFYETLFQAYIRAEQFEKIVDCESIILQKYPNSFALTFQLALAYKNLKQNKRAIDLYEKALKIDPSSHQAWFNLAYLYNIENQCKNAISALKMCHKMKPNDQEVKYFLSMALMKSKNYDKGLKLFENRFSRETAILTQKKSYPNLVSSERLWKGENIKNKTIFVYYEGGYGDTIMFARFLPLLKKRCKKLIFHPQKALVPIFSQSQLGIDEIIEGFIPEQNMDFDVHTPLMSLPYLLGLKGERIFESSEGFLYADNELVKEYKEQFFNNKKFKIGIKWQGNTSSDKDRVINTESFLPLLDIDNTQFYSFQTFEGTEDLSKLTANHEVIDIGSKIIDFGQTASALINLDLVICNDTSLAHLAGALGIPCFVLLPYETNWRWHEDLSKCDWYDSVKLFRQKSMGNWDSTIEEIKTIFEKANIK